jgi:hypothetical protein
VPYPSRLEQRNDRKLQPAKQMFCRHFRYEQREADIVLPRAGSSE